MQHIYMPFVLQVKNVGSPWAMRNMRWYKEDQEILFKTSVLNTSSVMCHPAKDEGNNIGQLCNNNNIKLDVPNYSITIFNISDNDAGSYTCKLLSGSTSNHNEANHLILSEHEVRVTTHNFSGIIFGTIFAALLLIILILCIIYLRHRCGQYDVVCTI